uniref:Uncharacterized protein n=1 Tax=viral metagenome TaxID=1070528 RepID=A0A6C0CUH2_9ZZZZ
MSTKKITVNPDLFNTSGSTRKNRGSSGEKKTKPVLPIQINENSLKKKFLNRIKEHKNKEKIESGMKSGGGPQNEIKVREQIANQTNDADEFRDSLQYLSLLSKKKKEEGVKKRNMATLQNKTVKNPYSQPASNIPPHVELELPEELKESITVSPETPSINLNFDEQYKNYFNHNNHLSQAPPRPPPRPRPQHILTQNPLQSKPTIQVNSFQVEKDPPYGCLKNANKPTYRNWVRTKRNTSDTYENPQLEPSSNIHFSPDPQNERQKRLEQLRKKIKEDEIQKLNSYNHATGFQYAKEKEVQMPILNSAEPSSQNTITQVAQVTQGGSANVEEEPNKRYIKRTVKKKYTLGKSNIYRKVGILIKNNATRKKIINAQKELKKKNIHDIKKYLIEHGLLKVGSNAPNNVLRKIYESAMLTGEVVNQNKDVLIHNLINDTGDHV